jgi:hypothetical protein
MADETRTELLTPSTKLGRDLREGAVAAFGSDGAWLVLSQFWYGWRAYYDVALAAVTGQRPADDASRPYPVGADFQIALDLHVQGLVFSAAEQFAGLLRAARAHEPGTDAFLRSYVDTPPIGSLIKAVADVTFEDVAHLVALPSDPAEILAESERLRGASGDQLDPRQLETVDVGGLLMLKSTINREAATRMLQGAAEVADLVARNAQELRQLVEPDPVADTDDGPAPQPLREIDNSFRHGLRLLFRDALPEARQFGIIGPASAQARDHLVDVYLPKGTDTVRFGTVDCSPDRTLEHLAVLRELCTRSGQLVRGFLGAQALHRGGLFVISASLELPPVPKTIGS